MSREKPKELYIAKVTKFGNGAKIKAYKQFIGKEVIVMTREKLKEKKLDDKLDKLEDEIEEEYSKYSN